jgi:hypothetical protein
MDGASFMVLFRLPPHKRALGGDAGLTPKIGRQHGRQADRAIGLLAVFKHGDQTSSDSQTGSVQGGDKFRLAAPCGPIARIHPPGLELAAG